jgi:SAM-dependent methyltransferase
MEEIPLPDASVDVVISNCVINLSADKDRVLREVARVLRPGGRFAVTDVVVRRPLPEAIRRSMELWAGCVAGALLEDEYRTKLADAGFDGITVEPVRIYSREDAVEAMGGSCCGDGTSASGCGDGEQAVAIDPAEVDGALMSAFVRAVKPGA